MSDGLGCKSPTPAKPSSASARRTSTSASSSVKKRAKRLKNRLGELRAVENVSQLRLGRPHALTADRAGQYSVDLDGPMRLLFEPTDQPPPTLPSGGIDWQQVSSVRLLEIGDTHD